MTLRRTEGFTLIELSIVLVIIGLIVGGVLVGQDLIGAAYTRKVMTNLEKYQTAINTFRVKYNCYPGDCSNATTFFGQNPNCATQGAGTGTQTCNGNGDGLTNYGEYMFWSWQQLSAAGLIEGGMTGVPGPGGSYDAIIGTNTPSLGDNTAGCELVAFASDDWGGPTAYFPHSLQNVSYCGAKVANDWTYSWGFNAGFLRRLDQKLDDGKPGTGRVRTAASSACVTSTDPVTAVYNNTMSWCGQLLLLLGRP